MKSKRFIFTAFVGMVGFTCIAFLAAQCSAHSGNIKDITFNKDVAPILYRKCSTCHHPNGGAKLALLSYRDARPWVRSIKEKVISREMPPPQSNQLSQQEIDIVVEWANQGAREGNPNDLPKIPKFSDGIKQASKADSSEQETSKDQSKQKQSEQQASQPQDKPEVTPTQTGPKITNDEVIQLVNAGLSEQVIITSIRQAVTKDFDLTPTGLIALKKAGVSDAVIVVMQEKGTPVQITSSSEAKTPPKYDATLAEPQKPTAAPAPQDGCSGIELMGLYNHDWRPTAPLIQWFAKVRNGTSLTRIVTVSWTNLYGETKSFQAQVKPGDIATLELTRQQPVERQPINLRLSSCR